MYSAMDALGSSYPRGMTGETGAASVGKRATRTEAASSCTSRLTPLLSVQFHLEDRLQFRTLGSLALDFGHQCVRETAGSKLSEFA